MCGRYSLVRDIDSIPLSFVPKFLKSEFKPSNDIKPSEKCLVLCPNDNLLEGVLAQWGFRNFFLQKRFSPINAKVETINKVPLFSDAYRYRRCLVPCDGFYEWAKLENGKKVPFKFSMSNGEVFFMAGIYSVLPDLKFTFAILTCPANDFVENYHHRMPVILEGELITIWNSSGEVDPHMFSKPYSGSSMVVSSLGKL